jgi:hypothetical protein
MVKVIKRNDRSNPKNCKSKTRDQRNSGSQMKKTVESWVHEFRSKRSRNESRLPLVGSLTNTAGQ